ncbi:DNA glycosylase AlkZ-like family protein [Nocardioides sp. AE5]|uniref:winged helix-turn-helix domain-containing protein n=1 Tax=Nocardioides sp. AE5 TaxID=2962573 RepID=UPI0028822C9B|nr:crosslink repair DNA glycosylase YcaQ family protein [Nocardioides sp. AE5]MDT0202093.1 crosslink repair DNA glycosylase YcaQ family protein [Nocardioides sp. AE5]
MDLSRVQARRIALAAQGFCDPTHAVPTLRTLRRTVERTGVLQVDSVNVLARAHLMPLYARMGPYDTDLLRRACQPDARRPRMLVEYWAHVQALMPVELWPLLAHRMEAYRERRGKWGAVEERPGLDADVLSVVRERGPVTARDLEDEIGGAARTREHWGWNWSEARKMLDFLYASGQVAIAGRTPTFEVVYDLPERVLPRAVLEAPVPTPEEASVELVRRAARSHGIATARCLADYYRMRLRPGATDGGLAAGPAIEALVEAGELVPVRVEGWQRPAYLHRDARRPRRVAARTLLSPFDPLVWERERTEQLFGFHYRIEIYVPAAQRVHGYYVLPFLLGDELVARVDLKADRATARLLVQAAYAEPGAPATTAAELARELHRMARWLGLDEVVVVPRGDLAPGLAAELALDG